MERAEERLSRPGVVSEEAAGLRRVQVHAPLGMAHRPGTLQSLDKADGAVDEPFLCRPGAQSAYERLQESRAQHGRHEFVPLLEPPGLIGVVASEKLIAAVTA